MITLLGKSKSAKS